MIESAIRQILVSDSAVASFVEQRVVSVFNAQPELFPKITYQRISNSRPATNDGPVDLATARIDLNLYAEDFAVCEAMARAVRRAIDGYRGTVSVVVGDGPEDIDIASLFVVDDSEQPTQTPSGEQSQRFRRVVELQSQWREVPAVAAGGVSGPDLTELRDSGAIAQEQPDIVIDL